MSRSAIRLLKLAVLGCWLTSPAVVAAAPGARGGDTLEASLARLARQHRGAAVSTLATSPGGRPVPLLTIAPSVDPGVDTASAVLVVADPLGTTPLATEAALALAARLLDGGATGRAAAVTWLIVPQLDPDGAARLHDDPVLEDGRNATAVDDDADGAADEDGPDDLDGDGAIAAMLLADPDGEWLLPPEGTLAVPRRADPARGERGLYRLLAEGRDDDGDLAWNEDPPGGVIPGRNFPHGFQHWQPTHGPWPASCPETRALLAFAFAHPEIAMVLVLGEANTLLQVPASADLPDPLLRKHTLPRGLARETGLDPLAQYGVDELVALLRVALRRPQLDADDVLEMLDLGPATAPDSRDLPWWRAVAADYARGLAAAGLGAPRVAPPASGPGAAEEWAYYQFGVPAFALDFWTPPLPVPAPADTSAALPDSTAPPAPAPDPALEALSRFAAAHPASELWRPWREVALPQDRRALVGGPAPGALRAPPAAMTDSLLSRQVPLLMVLAGWLPRLAGVTLEAVSRGGEVWEVTARVHNDGPLPYPTAQGRRARRPEPVVVTLEGAEVLEGLARQTAGQVPAMGSAAVRWLVRAPRGRTLAVRAAAPGFGAATATLQPATGGTR
ncbi:MAG: hypothetical protein IPH09_10540 [bacterium]|nr:hypothetical protein [bacterium]